MTVTSVPRPRQWGLPRLKPRLARLRLAAAGVLRQALSPARPVLKNLASMPLTVAGWICADFAAFHISHGWGFLATAVSLMILEHQLADE